MAIQQDDTQFQTRLREAYSRRQTKDLYSLFSEGQLHMVHSRERVTLRMLKKHGISELGRLRILDVGCGAGGGLRQLLNWGAQPENLVGVDLLEDRIENARRLCPADVELKCGSGEQLPFEDATFDIVLQSTVFTSILENEVKQRVATEIRRVVKASGIILWYDFLVNNPRNPDVRGVSKREIRGLFPDCDVDLRRTTLAPPIARWLGPRSVLLCELLSRIPFLCTHCTGIIQPKK
jgi:ubiquinone/menaquinone biosynthesis C-methylase UbiE